jgi:8-oxo-dGTP diphosphatase
LALGAATLYSLVMNEGIRYCQLCGRELGARMIDGKPRRHCHRFLDPKVAAAVLALVDGKLVLVKRGTEPQIGRWAFPSGFVDRGEAVEDAAVREFREETGLDARLERLIGVYSATGSPVVLVVYKASVVGGTLQAGHDTTDAALFDPERLPPLPFPHDDRILADWRALA